MKVGLVAVGSELLAGGVTNGNAAWLGRVLTEAGLEVTRSVAVGDDVDDIARTVDDELQRADALVLTGGLGPTSDDRTREALAVAAGVSLQRSRECVARLTAWYEERGRRCPQEALRQADVPEGAAVLDNLVGSAPGLRVETPAGVVFALPGVPGEMQAMVTRAVLPALLDRAGSPSPGVVRTLRTVGAGETTVAALLRPLEEQLARPQARGAGLGEAADVDIAYLASAGEVRVHLTGRGGAPGLAARVDAHTARARRLLGDLVYGEGEDSLDVVVHRLLAERDATVGVAESLTGGLLGGALTEMPGSSATFRGGVTAYATDLKASILGVDAALLERHGPVHPDVARAMARGARSHLGTTYGLATTGVAGPEPQGAPVGTVFVAVAGPDGERVVRLQRTAPRDVVRRHAVVAALDLLRREVLGLADPTPEESAR